MPLYKLADQMHKTSDKYGSEFERLKMDLINQIEKTAQSGKYELSTSFLRYQNIYGVETEILHKIVNFLKDEWFDVECAEDYYLTVKW